MRVAIFRRGIVWLLSGFLVLGALAGCGGTANAGGNTTCKDYMGMSNSKQEEVIKKFFSEKGNSNPSGFDVRLSLESARLYCNTIGTDSSPIRNIDG